MAKRYIKASYNYETDIDGLDVQLNSGFYCPPHLSGQDTDYFKRIIEIIGGTITKDLAFGFDEDKRSICSEGAFLTPRKAVFQFDNGSSMSLCIPSSTNLLTAVSAANNLIQNTGGVKVICVALQGEKIKNINDYLGIEPDEASTTPAAGSGKYYSGKVYYMADSGKRRVIAVKAAATNDSAPPPIFSDNWGGCVGKFIDDRYACDVGSRFDHRRFIVRYRTVNSNKSNEPESRELPVTANKEGETSIRKQIHDCGLTLVGNKSIFCVSYLGESDPRYDRNLAEVNAS